VGISKLFLLFRRHIAENLREREREREREGNFVVVCLLLRGTEHDPSGMCRRGNEKQTWEAEKSSTSPLSLSV